MHAFHNSEKFEGSINYHSTVGRSEILYAVHQVAKYSSGPRLEHRQAIIYIIKY
jgi:hypothetical protein